MIALAHVGGFPIEETIWALGGSTPALTYLAVWRLRRRQRIPPRRMSSSKSVWSPPRV